MILLVDLINEASEEELENKAKEIKFPEVGSFDYVLVDKSLNVVSNGNYAFITGVASEKNPDMTPKRGTGILRRMAHWIKTTHPNVKYILGNPISNDAATAFAKSFGVPVKRGKIFKIKI